MIQGKLRLGLAGAVLAVSGVSAFAFATAGRVTTAIGSASIVRGSESILAQKDSVVHSGDTLRTPVDSRLQWWMEDDSLIAMASSSRVQVRNFKPDAGEARYVLQRGGMRIVSGTTQPVVLTPVATVKAMGTDFSMFVCDEACSRANRPPDNPGNGGSPPGQGNNPGNGGAPPGRPGDSDESLYVRIDEGRVRVENSAGKVDAVKGQIVFVASAQVAPKIIPEAPALFLEVALELEFEVGGSDFVPDVPIQPLPPIELPGSPS